MQTLLYLAVIGIGLAIAASVVRGAWLRRDSERRRAEREAYRGRQEAARMGQAEAAIASLVGRFFPFAKAAWDSSAGRDDARTRLRRALAETEGIVLGTADIGFDAVLPDSARRQHLICLGKSGFGKTSIAVRMIRDDLRRGRGVCILGAEAELFRDQILGLVPAARARDTMLFRPADPACSLSWNPVALEDNEDQALAAGHLFSIFKECVGETSIGARADAILSAAFGVLVGRAGATLWSVIRLLEDETYRATVLTECADPYLKEFWERTYPEYPAGAALPLANRLHQFLRLPQLRASLCHPISSFSIRDALANSRILLFDLSGLDPDATRLVGQMLLSKFQIELMRRERVPEDQRPMVCVHVDEFHQFAGAAEGTWRALLARGRRFGLSLALYTQHLGQIPRSLQQEIFGNVSSVIALNLSAGDAAAVRRELLVPGADGTTRPVPAEAFVSFPVGEGFARLGSGAGALRVKFKAPIEKPDPRHGERVGRISWQRYAAPALPPSPEPVRSVAANARDTEAVAAVEPSSPGRGGPQHKLIQGLAREWGEARGYRATVEQEVLGGAGRIDVVLEREGVRVAVEVSVTSSPAEVADTVGKCLAAGFDHIVVVSTDNASLRRTERAAAQTIPAKDANKVRFVTPDGLRSFLDGLPASADVQALTAGFMVRVQAPAAGRIPHRTALARLVGDALLRRRVSS